jgi:hypothetical protein
MHGVHCEPACFGCGAVEGFEIGSRHNGGRGFG